MIKNTVESRYNKALGVCRIVMRITGREMYHGETDYEFSEVLECMNEKLVEEIISTGSSEDEYASFVAENGMLVDDYETRWEFALEILETSFLTMTL